MKTLKKIILTLIALGIIGCTVLMAINIYVVKSVDSRIVSQHDAAKLDDIDCIIVLGAGVRNGNATPMLQDRIDTGVKLYFMEASQKLLMSGDHGRAEYDEVNVMKDSALEQGVPSEDVFMDHAGFSTYDSIYRAKEIFGAEKIVIVTQKYHLYRALYIAKQLGIEAYGVEADARSYRGATYREAREVLARNKDFTKCIIKPKSKYLGEAIPIWGDGNITNDR